jgi:DNA-binding response OmpR family regulator
MAQKHILVIEDDLAIRRGLIDGLRFAGYGTLEAGNAVDGQTSALERDCDLVLLDLVLPGFDGLSVLRAIRVAHPSLPVIILTARAAEDDRVRGLRLGADDYVIKPFSIKELLARVEAVLRRSPERPTNMSTLRFPGGRADFERHELCFDDGARCDLSERELKLLKYFANHSGRAISREEILARVWGLDPAGITTRTIDMHVARLREKLRDDSSDPQIVRTVRGRGYMLARGGLDS